MTCTQCVTIMGPCREDITQVTEQRQQPTTNGLWLLFKLFFFLEEFSNVLIFYYVVSCSSL